MTQPGKGLCRSEKSKKSFKPKGKSIDRGKGRQMGHERLTPGAEVGEPAAPQVSGEDMKRGKQATEKEKWRNCPASVSTIPVSIVQSG